VGTPKILFARIDMEKMLDEIAAHQAQKDSSAEQKTQPQPEGVAQIGIDEFARVDLRIAKVIACEKIPKADKLLLLQVQMGQETRQIVSGIAKWYAPEDLVGKNVVVVANLKPAKLRGIESCGMILAAEGGPDDVRVIFAEEDISSGSKVR
jgi:methionyl-tRNA synthetase